MKTRAVASPTSVAEPTGQTWIDIKRLLTQLERYGYDRSVVSDIERVLKMARQIEPLPHREEIWTAVRDRLEELAKKGKLRYAQITMEELQKAILP